VLYILRNPNFSKYNFTKIQILKLWGELFYWALAIINLKPAYNNPSITRYEAYLGVKPDLRVIRLLPIFSGLYVLRRAANTELHSTSNYWQFGLYVGPSPSVPGAIRAAVITNKELYIITTSAIKGVSDGGQVSIYPTPDVNIQCLYEVDTRVHDPTAIAHIPEMIPRPLLPPSRLVASELPPQPPTVVPEPSDPVPHNISSPSDVVDPVDHPAPSQLQNPVSEAPPLQSIVVSDQFVSQTSTSSDASMMQPSSIPTSPNPSQRRSRKHAIERPTPIPPPSIITILERNLLLLRQQQSCLPSLPAYCIYL